MSDIEVVFRTRSEIEASVVQGLLESQGLHVIRVSGPPSNVFAFSVSTLGDIHVAVPVEEAAEARRALQSHGDAGSAGLSVPLASQLGAVEQRLGYVFRDRGHLEHARIARRALGLEEVVIDPLQVERAPDQGQRASHQREHDDARPPGRQLALEQRVVIEGDRTLLFHD